MNILHRLRRQEQYYRLFLGGFAAMPLTVGIIKRFIRFIRNKYKLRSLLAVAFLPIGLNCSAYGHGGDPRREGIRSCKGVLGIACGRHEDLSRNG